MTDNEIREIEETIGDIYQYPKDMDYPSDRWFRIVIRDLIAHIRNREERIEEQKKLIKDLYQKVSDPGNNPF